MRILHTGDLHLDSAFSAFGQRDAEQYRELGRTLLKNIYDCARHEKCDMILISGDLFDSKFVSNDTRSLFVSLVKGAGIPTVISPGNHDPYSENSFYANIEKENIESLYVFSSPEIQVFDFDELRVRVFGYAFASPILNENPLLKANLPTDNGYLKLLCAHTDTSSPLSRYAPISASELSRFGFAYCALGHVHNADESEDSEGRIRYCGFAEGRSFDELGEGGVYIVDVDETSCETKRIVLSSRAFFLDECGVPNDREVEKISAYLKGRNYPSNAYLRLTLVGAADSQSVKVIKNSKDRICESAGLEYLEIEDETLPIYDGKYLEKDVTIRGEIYRSLLPSLTSADAEVKKKAVLALKIALAAIDGNNVFDVTN
ncbi:MAG: exonuclease SbcCD subunit D [Clostridia bacterium]|nr:exonuclease SbcCD subunit D [Clostridia bacterium]